MLADEFARKSVLPHWTTHVAAARGLVETGSHDVTGDVMAITKLMREEGIRQHGETTALVWGQEPGKRTISITTALHESQEQEFIQLAQAAASDRSAALPERLLRRKIEKSGLDFAGEHGKAQRAAIERLGLGGRFGLTIAAAGAGKTTALKPLVAAWRDQGRTVYGASLAWRQADDLTSAGIDKSNVKAFSVLLDGVREGSIRLDRNTVVAVDEWGLIGTWGALHLLRMQQRYGFAIVALGDDKQCASVEAGSIIELSRRALGAEQVPEILTTRRQQTERERTIAGLFREGRAAEALDMKRADGTAEMAYGGYDGVVARVAKLYRERVEATGAAPTISAPTNTDAHRIGVAVRDERRRSRAARARHHIHQGNGWRAKLYPPAGTGRPGSPVPLDRREIRNRARRSHRAQRLGAGSRRCRQPRHHAALEARQGRHRALGRHAQQARPRAAGLRLRDDDPHGARLDDPRAYQRATVRQPGHRWAARVFRAHAAPDEGLPHYQRRRRADRGAQAARAERYTRHHRRRQMGTGGARAQLPAREGQRALHVRSCRKPQPGHRADVP